MYVSTLNTPVADLCATYEFATVVVGLGESVTPVTVIDAAASVRTIPVVAERLTSDVFLLKVIDTLVVIASTVVLAAILTVAAVLKTTLSPA